jgi:hypothetical protein
MPASPSVYSDREDEHGVAPRPGERYLGLGDRRDGVGLSAVCLLGKGGSTTRVEDRVEAPRKRRTAAERSNYVRPIARRAG